MKSAVSKESRVRCGERSAHSGRYVAQDAAAVFFDVTSAGMMVADARRASMAARL